MNSQFVQNSHPYDNSPSRMHPQTQFQPLNNNQVQNQFSVGKPINNPQVAQTSSFLLPPTQQVQQNQSRSMGTRQWQNYDIQPPQSDNANYDQILQNYNQKQDQNQREHQERNKIIQNLERTLEEERQRTHQMRVAMQQDVEKEQRQTLEFENNIKQLREDAYRKDEAMTEMQKQIAHLKEENYRLDDFNKQQAQQIYLLKEELSQNKRQYEDDMRRYKINVSQQDDRYRQDIDRLTQENNNSIESLNKQWDFKYKSLEEKCNNLLQVKAGIEQELRAMDEEMVKERIIHDERLREKIVDVQQEEQRKYQSSLRTQEQKLQSLEQSFQNMVEKNKELISELSEREKTLREQSLVLEQINSQNQQEQADLNNQINHLQLYRESLSKDLNSKENELRKVETEFIDLQRNIQAMRDKQTQEIQRIEEENRVEKTRLEAIRDKQARKIGEQEKTMSQMDQEIDKLKDEKEQLRHQLQNKIKNTIDNTVNDPQNSFNDQHFGANKPQHSLKY